MVRDASGLRGNVKRQMACRDRWHWAIAAAYVAWALIFIESTRVRTPDGLVWSCLFDDAMISMRYARNLAEGNGLVFNPGERVQGFSNPLMTLCMSALIALLGPTRSIGAVQLLGIPTVLACAFLAARITRNLFPEADEARTFAFVATLAYYPLSFWSLTGMETGLLTALLLGAVVSIQSAGWLAAGLLLGLAYLTRPDALVPAAILLASLRSMGAPRSAVLKSATVVAAFVVVTGLCQFLYYGAWLPNTYTLKVEGVPLSFRLENGLRFTAPLLADAAPIILLSVAGWKTAGRLGAWLRVMCVAAVAYQIFVGGDSWPGYWRFTTPFIPVALALAAWHLGPEHQRGRSLPVRWILAALVILAGNGRFLGEWLLLTPPLGAETSAENVRIARAVHRITTEDAVVGSPFAGAIPYFSERRAVDFLGKADRRIAGLAPDLSGAVGWGGLISVPGHNKYDLAYSIGERKPDYVQMFRWGNQEANSTGYVTVWYGRFLLRLRRDSPRVRWDRLRCRSGECRAINPWR